MTELSVLERVRAAVAEAGYDPRQINPPGDPRGPFNYGLLPHDVVWRAAEAVEVMPSPLCLACARVRRDILAWGLDPATEMPPCLADRRFVEDCGRDRSEP